MRVPSGMADRRKAGPQQRAQVIVDLPIDQVQGARGNLQQAGQVIRSSPQTSTFEVGYDRCRYANCQACHGRCCHLNLHERCPTVSGQEDAAALEIPTARAVTDEFAVRPIGGGLTSASRTANESGIVPNRSPDSGFVYLDIPVGLRFEDGGKRNKSFRHSFLRVGVPEPPASNLLSPHDRAGRD